MTVPLITIGITCYREGDWLHECWESVLAQTDERWVAVLVMDGGADERTQQIFAQLEHPKLTKYALPENMGPYPTRNKAFALTMTPYHFYLDADDQLLPETIAIVLATFTAHSDAGFIYGDFEWFWDDQTTSIRKYPIDPQPTQIPLDPLPGPGAYATQVWHQLGGYADEFCRGAGDLDFHLSMAEVGIRAYHIRSILYRYRMGHAAKVSSSYNKQLAEKFTAMVARHPRLFADHKLRQRFLARGYHESSLAYYWDTDVRLAARFAWQAIIAGQWRVKYLWVIWVAAYLPPPLERWLRRAWRQRLGWAPE